MERAFKGLAAWVNYGVLPEHVVTVEITNDKEGKGKMGEKGTKYIKVSRL